MCVSDLHLNDGLYGQLRFPPLTKDQDNINETLLNAVLNIHKVKFVTYHRVCNKSKTTFTTSGTGTETLPEHLSLPLGFSGVRVARSLVFCV